MARPRKHRLVACEIHATYFKPQGIPIRQLEEIVLDMDEVEAIRLADIENLYHAEAALKMGVSRPTFGNIIASAHKKIATALLGGKALRISDADDSIHLAQQIIKNPQIEPSDKDDSMKTTPSSIENQPQAPEENAADAPRCCGQGHGHAHNHEPGHECSCNGDRHGDGSHSHANGHGRGHCCGGKGRRQGTGCD
ncbi:MAG: DUF134 domain-containing protein [Burkholderiaceae bacterium]|nr:DUF134 domain-containing protein [Burkholderiaceae bacterium]